MQSNTLSHKGLMYLFASVAFALLLHSEFLPVWVLGLAAVIMVWRYIIFTGKVKKANGMTKSILVCLGFYGVYYSYGIALSIESAVTLLVASLSLKPLEVQTKRDSYVLLFLCILVQGQHFLFEQGPLAYLLVLMSLFVTLISLVFINQSARSNSHVSVSIKLFLFSLPLTLFLFFVLPRLGPLWSINMSTKAGVIGLSDSMSPGDVSELGRSDELAFRVKFIGDVPAMEHRYWRALVLDYFDGEKWEASYRPDVARSLSSDTLRVNDSFQYEIITQAHEKKWLYALQDAEPETDQINVLENGLLVYKYKVMNAFQYQVKSNKPVLFDSPDLQGIQVSRVGRGGNALTALQRQAYLQLPASKNERSRQLVSNFVAVSDNQLDVVKNISEYFLSNPFSYTLSPGLAESEHRVDEFLFETQLGFCAHYAGSVVFLLRGAGIPARVVLGYLGGEENPIGNYYSVYQYDAHAWVEFWIEGVGWLSIDPTGWVSPDRVSQGVEFAVQSEFVGFKTEHKWLRGIRDQLQAFNYHWNDWMLGYKGEKQQAMMASVFGNEDSYKWPIAVALLFLVTIGIVFFFVLKVGVKTKQSLNAKLLNNYVGRLKKLGVDVDVSMTFLSIEAKVIDRYPMATFRVKAITQLLNDAIYTSRQSKLDKRITKEYKKNMVKLIASCGQDGSQKA